MSRRTGGRATKELLEMFNFSKVVQALNSVGSIDLICRDVQVSDEAEGLGELGWDLGDQVGGEVALGELGLAQQVEDRVRHLDQLARGEVQLAQAAPLLLGLASLSAPLHD